MKYGENKLREILDEALKGGTQPDFEDWCHGADFLKAFHEGHIKKGDPVLMFSIDGAQLYRSKTSDCWMYIWVIFNLDPATGRYKKVGVLFGAVIPGPNKPKILESFLFPGLHHLSAIQKEGYPYGMPPPTLCTYQTHTWHSHAPMVPQWHISTDWLAIKEKSDAASTVR
jgi:hypothetical protein